MEFSFSQLKQKDVINISDGKNLGRVCDISFTYPENTVTGFTVTGCKGFRLTKQEQFISMKSVVKIGEDTVLVKNEKGAPPPPKCPPKHKNDCCPPPECPPPYPRDRRSYDEYE